MNLRSVFRRNPKHARSATASKPVPASKVAIPLPADRGDGFGETLGAQAPAVAPIFAGASETGLMAAPTDPQTALIPEVAHPEPADVESAESQRARLQEVAPDLLDDMTLIDVPPCVLRPVNRTTAPGKPAGGEHRDEEPAPVARPYAPANVAGTAGQVPAGPPPAFLRAIMPGRANNPQEPLAGCPSFVGLAATGYGTRVAGLCLGADDDGWLVVDVLDVGWLDELISSAMYAKDALEYGGFRPQLVASDGGAQ
jgi:hypothetical protein